MNDVVDFERDFRRAKQGENLIYTTLHGLNPDLSKPRDQPEILEEVKKLDNSVADETEDESSEEDDEDTEEEDDSEGEDEEGSVRAPKINMEIHVRPRDESPNSRKLRKIAVKEEKREKRKNKTPKHVKKRAEKLAKIKKHTK